MKKTVISALILSAMLVTLSACGEAQTTKEKDNDADISTSAPDSNSSKDEVSEESPESSEEETKASEFEFKIKSTSLSKDFEEKDVLIIEYDYTNNSDKATSFSFACQDTVFQDGVECDSTVVGCDEVDTQEQLNDVQPGKTYTLKVGYHITDTSKPVDVVITDLLGMNNLLEESIDLSNAE